MLPPRSVIGGAVVVGADMADRLVKERHARGSDARTGRLRAARRAMSSETRFLIRPDFEVAELDRANVLYGDTIGKAVARP